MDNESLFPLLPLRDIVVFPNMVVTLFEYIYELTHCINYTYASPFVYIYIYIYG